MTERGDADFYVNIPGKGAFYNTGLDDWLKQRGITHPLFTGVTTEVCVQTSLREANDCGYECLIVEDATESYFPEFKRATLDMRWHHRLARTKGDSHLCAGVGVWQIKKIQHRH